MANSKTPTSNSNAVGTNIINMAKNTSNINYYTGGNTQVLESSLNNSMRLFGIPHQFTEHNDPRIGDKSNLGRCFAERIMLEAPTVCLKPGITEFLPGKSEAEKASVISQIKGAASSSWLVRDVFGNMSTDDEDAVMYYNHKSAYSDMMAKVNILCKLMSVFLGISNVAVPWAKGGVTFGNYDWRYYTMKNQFNDVNFTNAGGSRGSVGAFIRNAMSSAENMLMSDNEWVRFYVDGNASFGESASNSTTTSILESFTEKLEGIAKELDVVSGLTGTDVGALASDVGTSVDEYIQQNVSGDGAMGTFLKRLSGNTKQILSGGNFLIPEIWSNSEYNKSYSFTITLSTPYGCKESWFLNIGVPLMHILGLCLPQQLTANTYKSPYLVKCYSPGWFNCNLGIIDSVSIDKGSDNSWSVGGLPNEIKVSLSVKDLYSTLSIPVKPYESPQTFLSTGMLEFLAVNCGIDITNQNMSDRIRIWTTIIGNNFTDRFTSKPYEVQQYFKSKVQGLFNIVK